MSTLLTKRFIIVGAATVMTVALLAVVGRGVLLSAAEPAAPAPAAAAGQGPVVVELFTAQGCSSCPPADHLLSRIGTDPHLGGSNVIALGFHVDYWNHQGWFDPFSSAQWTQRQATYDKVVFHSDNVYTPQLVVNGRTECVGSKEPEVTNLITTALANAPAGQVTLTPPEKPLPPTGGGSLRVNVSAHLNRQVSHDLELWVALTENHLTTAVRGGENASLTLNDDHVVRQMVKAFNLKETAGSEHSGKVDLKVDPTWKGPFQIVAFLQDPKSLNIEGAAALPLAR